MFGVFHFSLVTINTKYFVVKNLMKMKRQTYSAETFPQRRSNPAQYTYA